ncbi:MAG TPA: hypothetical protein DD781_01860 [Leclercia adecarboxylata]|nr:hypothetical protein [Leclercia adecarboxylata]
MADFTNTSAETKAPLIPGVIINNDLQVVDVIEFTDVKLSGCNVPKKHPVQAFFGGICTSE